MEWLMFSLMAALTVSTQDAWMKKRFSHLTPYEMSAYPLLYSLPLFLFTALFVSKPPLDSTFWWTFPACLPLESAAILIYMKSIKISPLSLTIPYLAFTPVFILVTGYVFLGEVPDSIGIIGVFVTVAGSYILNSTSGKQPLLAPFKNVLNEKGSWQMLIVAMLYSLTSVLAKKAILHSSPIFFGVSFCLTFNMMMIIVLLSMRKISLLSLLTRHSSQGFAVGALFFLQIMAGNLAMSFTKVAYMISVKRMSILFSVLYGGILFSEEQLLKRLLGAAIMVSGAVLISIWGK
jgi:uncharacterized membrane protein